MTQRKWEIVASEIVLDSPWYRLRRDACRLPGGQLVESYYVREHDGFAVVFALTAERNVVMTRQYKHGVGDVVLELPAGAVEPGESPTECARRELEEETGYVAARLEPLGAFVADPTSSTGRLFLFLAHGAARTGTASPDATEDIETLLVPYAELIERVRSREVIVQSHVAAIYAALDHLGLISISAGEG